jgi:hypothetical protein
LIVKLGHQHHLQQQQPQEYESKDNNDFLISSLLSMGFPYDDIIHYVTNITHSSSSGGDDDGALEEALRYFHTRDEGDEGAKPTTEANISNNAYFLLMDDNDA